MHATKAGIPEDELNAAQKARDEIKIKAFDYATQFARDDGYDPTTSGYKSVEHAIVSILTKAARECEAIIRKLEKKYPL